MYVPILNISFGIDSLFVNKSRLVFRQFTSICGFSDAIFIAWLELITETHKTVGVLPINTKIGSTLRGCIVRIRIMKYSTFLRTYVPTPTCIRYFTLHASAKLMF